MRLRRSRSSSAISTFILETLSFSCLSGQRHTEARAAFARTLGDDLAAMPIDDGLHDPQPETESTRLGLDIRAAPEALKDRGGAAVRNSRAFVFDPRRHSCVRRGCADTDGAGLGRELARVGDE